MISIEISACSLFIILYAKNKGYDLIFLLKMILIAGMVQAIISIITFFYTPLQNSIIQLFISNGIGDVIKFYSYLRFYGFSYYLTSTAPLTQAVLACIAITLGLYKSKRYWLFVPFLFFSAMINSRTSIFVFLMGITAIVSIIITKKDIKKILKLFPIAVISLSLIKFLANIIQSHSVHTYNWIMTGIEELSYFLSGSKIGYFDVLANDFIIIPEGLVLLFGKGISLFGTIGGSDVGFINSLWIGGLLLTVWVYGGLLYFYSYTFRYKNSFIRSISLVIIISFIVANIKGNTISANEFSSSSILITSILLFYTAAVSNRINFQKMDGPSNKSYCMQHNKDPN